MLFLTRRLGERLLLTLPDGRQVTVLVAEISRERVRLGIEAPRDIPIYREEIWDAILANLTNNRMERVG